MKQNIEDLAEIMANARPNERYCFAVEGANVIPHFFRIQKVRLTDDEDCDMFVIANDEGVAPKVYSLYEYRGLSRPFSLAEKRRAVVHILWDCLNAYNSEMRRPGPFDFAAEQDAGTAEAYKATEEALDVFRYRHLIELRQY